MIIDGDNVVTTEIMTNDKMIYDIIDGKMYLQQ